MGLMTDWIHFWVAAIIYTSLMIFAHQLAGRDHFDKRVFASGFTTLTVFVALFTAINGSNFLAVLLYYTAFIMSIMTAFMSVHDEVLVMRPAMKIGITSMLVATVVQLMF